MNLNIELKWRDVSVDGLPDKAQEVLFVRNNKTVHGAFIGGSFWYNNQKCCALYWMPLPSFPKEENENPSKLSEE